MKMLSNTFYQSQTLHQRHVFAKNLIIYVNKTQSKGKNDFSWKIKTMTILMMLIKHNNIESSIYVRKRAKYGKLNENITSTSTTNEHIAYPKYSVSSDRCDKIESIRTYNGFMQPFLKHQISCCRENSMLTICQSSNVYFDNICFDSTKMHTYFKGTIVVEENCRLWMENCIINTNRIGINVCENARCYVKNCTFIGGSIGIKINTMANKVKLLITNCTFTNCGSKTRYDKRGDNGAVVIEFGQEPEPGAKSKRTSNNVISHNLDIRIINNKFVNNFTVPIVLKQYPNCRYICVE